MPLRKSHLDKEKKLKMASFLGIKKSSIFSSPSMSISKNNSLSKKYVSTTLAVLQLGLFVIEIIEGGPQNFEGTYYDLDTPEKDTEGMYADEYE